MKIIMQNYENHNQTYENHNFAYRCIDMIWC